MFFSTAYMGKKSKVEERKIEMTQIKIRDAVDEDFDRIVTLNMVEVQQTSAMDRSRLQELAQMASYHRVATVDGVVAAFLLAFRENAGYDNANYAWFSARFEQFIYVDRIVVSADFGGLKIGSLLYQDLFEFARSHGVHRVTCEYNIQPPNPASHAFHQKFGFKEIGSHWVANGTKQVSLQVAEI
jgi:predicted GNAT superfamily acetyltransferase